jgi:hypothetical protein
MATVFRFKTWDITNDCFQNSMRWATKEAIERVSGEPVGDGVEIDDNWLGGEVDGMTRRGFDPHHPRHGFGS